MKMRNSLVLSFCVLGVMAATALGQNPGIGHRPLDVEAQPPHHVRFAATSGPRGYSPAQIRHAYGVDQFTSTGALRR